ncbi:MAG: group II intron reverse transcriptase domain-containing protein [Verrucomicrobia bacterium]|nr:group II intron reverse transcriptase domain-containing protein [Verrucomicrobiota bacterium]
MRRAGGLWPQLVARENLRLAFWKAARGVRRSSAVQRYAADLEGSLERLAARLEAGEGPEGQTVEFHVRDPKLRLISAPCFPDRVLHHAVMNVCEPVFERAHIFHTYACRPGKGQFAALAAASRFARGHGWFVKADVRKYFESIDRARLRAQLRRRVKDGRVLALLDQLTESWRPGTERGLPIGSLTSQHFANLYLGPLDRFVTERRREGAYVRYMDDFAVWVHASETAVEWTAALRDYASEHLGLELKIHANRTAHGMDFLGHRVRAQGPARANRRSRVRFARRVWAVERALAAGELTEAVAQQRLTSLAAFVHQTRRASRPWA